MSIACAGDTPVTQDRERPDRIQRTPLSSADGRAGISEIWRQVNDRFGSLADALVDFSLMSASGGKADVQNAGMIVK